MTVSCFLRLDIVLANSQQIDYREVVAFEVVSTLCNKWSFAYCTVESLVAWEAGWKNRTMTCMQS